MKQAKNAVPLFFIALGLTAALAFVASKFFRAPISPVSNLAAEPESGTATIIETNGAAARARGAGGAVIVDANGHALELIPPKRPAPAPGERALEAVAALPKISLPALDDPAANLETRKRRALGLLQGSALAAVALVFWARRWRSGP